MKKSFFTLIILATMMISPLTYAQKAHSTTVNFDTNINEQKAITQFMSKGRLSSNNTFQLIRSTTDKMGYVHNRYQQYFRGIKVEFGTLITHSLNGNVVSITGEVYPISKLNLSPNLSEDASLLKAVQHLGISRSTWFENGNLKRSTDMPETELLIIPDYSNDLKSVVLAYKHKVTASDPGLVGDVYINAHTGSNVLYNPIMKHFNRKFEKPHASSSHAVNKTTTTTTYVPGTAETRFSGTRTIETRLESNGTYTLNDEANNIFTKDALNGHQGSKPYLNGVFEEFTDNDNNWTAAEHNNAAKDDAALDAHFGAIEVKKYWENVHNRDSYDDNGASIFSFVHVGTNYFNAFWDGVAMSYGDGNSNPLTGFDICAHEIGHAVTTHTANLVYANQSGGLNEGFSDIWGAAIQHYSLGTGTDATPDNSVWAIGETIGTLRSMSNPKAYSSPDTYLGTFWRETGDEGNCSPNQNNDNCGVHFNSGVLNHWFYILVNGAADTNDLGDVYDVNGIGMTKAEEIAYLALRDYLTPNATFADAREATLTVVSNLYCLNSSEAESVQNAWYAVNVGDAYFSASDDIHLKSVSNGLTVDCSNTAFIPVANVQNAGSNPITAIDLSYTVDGGTPITDNISTSLNTCESEQINLPLPTLGIGVHTVDVTTTITNDERVENNTQSAVVLVNEGGTLGEVNTFENSSDILLAYNDGTPQNSLWERGTASTTLLNSGSNNVYATNLDGNHPVETKAFLVSKCYDLSNTDATLKFNMAFDLEANWDILYMEYSTDGGSTWNILGSASDPNWYNSDRPAGTNNDCFNCPGAQWTGNGENDSNATSKEYSHNLDHLDGNSGSPATNVVFRFTFHSDQAVNEEGVVIDDFVVESAPLSIREENVFQNFSYAPNPTNDALNVRFTPNSFDQDITISVFDISGRKVLSKSYTPENDFNTTLNLGQFNAGLYLMKVDQNDQSQVAKIIIK